MPELRQFYLMAVKHGHSTNASRLRSRYSVCDVSEESSQVERLHPERNSGRHIGLGQVIARVRRLGLFGHVAGCSCDVPASNIVAISYAAGDG